MQSTIVPVKARPRTVFSMKRQRSGSTGSIMTYFPPKTQRSDESDISDTELQDSGDDIHGDDESTSTSSM